MKRIDADALIEKINEIDEIDYGSCGSYESHSAVRDVLRDIKRIIYDEPEVEE